MAFSGVVKVSDIDDYMDVISTIFDFSAILIFFFFEIAKKVV